MSGNPVISALFLPILTMGALLALFEKRIQPTQAQPLTQLNAPLIINEYLADPGGSGSGDLQGDANNDGTRDSADDEFVELVNTGNAPLNIGLFTISDAAQARFTIPAGKVIPPGESAVVFGGGTPTGAFGNATANGLVFAAGAGGLSLNNGGDTITVKDNLAATVTSVTFGAAEGGANQSITRNPDISGNFTTHSTASGSGGSLFSPGSRVNGSPFTTTDPIIISISPEGAVAGNGDVTLAVDGMNFEAGSLVRVNGSSIPTEFIDANQLFAQIPETVTTGPGILLITVQNPDGVISNPASFTLLAPIGINEYLADPPDGPSGDANADGMRDSAQDEFIEIVNRSSSPIDVSGFTVRDADAQRFIFPAGSSLPAGEAAVIFGGGSPQGDFGNVRVNGLLFTASLSLNNGGDTIELRNSQGIPVESITFGSTEGSANQSINRNPDVLGIAFAPHSSIFGAGSRLFSPGTLVNGSAFTLGPRITAIDPDSADKGASPFDLVVTGTGFEGSSNVLIDRQGVATRFIDPGQIVARIPVTVTGVSGTHMVQVQNEGGNLSNSATLTIVPPAPFLQSITPRVVQVGIGAFTMFVTGLNFTPGAAVFVDGTPIATSFFNADLRAIVPASFTATTGTRAVVVRNSDGKQSNALAFEVVPPTTVVSSLTPNTITAGAPDFPVLVRGANFKNNALALFDDAELVTSFRSQTELIAQVPSALVAKPGIHAFSVQNAGEASSNEAVFQVLPDPPLIGSLDPVSVIEGSGDVTVKILGQKFQPGASVRTMEATRRGTMLETIFLSSEILSAKLPRGFTQTSGSVLLVVENSDFGVSNVVALKVLIKDPLVINEYLADPADTLAGDANGDGTRSSSADEFIEILNRSGEPFDISGYRILDSEAIRHVFAEGTILPPFETALVFGGGKPTGSFGNASDNHLVFTASTGGLSLNNGGDSIRLQDAQARVVQEIKFGALEGGAGQSVNRDPDGDGATFAIHSIVASDTGRLFSPGSKASGQAFTIKPIVDNVSPATIRVGSNQFTLTVLGSRFFSQSTILFNGTALSTTFLSETQLIAEVPNDFVSTGGHADIRIKNPRGELSGIVRLVITDDPPRLLGISPKSVGTGAESLEVEILGERFQPGASITVQGHSAETRFLSSTLLEATVLSTLFARAAELPVQVLNDDGNESNAVVLKVENGPLITRLSRGKVKAGGGAVELTIEGVAFKPGVIPFANGVALSTRFVDETTIIARIPAEMTNVPVVLMLQARNPDGGRSNIARLRIK